MKKDRLFLLDETVVPASLTQLREVTSTITTQIVIFHFKTFHVCSSKIIFTQFQLDSFLACFVSTFSRFAAQFLLAIKRLCVFNVELHYGAIQGWTPYVYYRTPYSSYTVYANLLDRFLRKVGKSEEEIVVQGVKYRV